MKFNYEHACQTFPGVDWTGGSGIHVSFAMNAGINIDFNNRQAVLAILLKAGYPDAVWKAVQSRFGHMEWLLEEDTFKKLLLVDMNRHLMGQPSRDSPEKFKNPATGNWFHRIALLSPYIGGIRFWAEEGGSGTHIGFRFRIVTQSDADEEENVRETARRLTEVVTEESVEVVSYMELAEPPLASDVASIKEQLCIFEE